MRINPYGSVIFREVFSHGATELTEPLMEGEVRRDLRRRGERPAGKLTRRTRLPDKNRVTGVAGAWEGRMTE